MSVILFDPTPICSDKDFFNRSMLPELPSVAYQSIFEPTDEWWQEPDTLTFSIPSLNLAATCLRKYLETQHTFDWIHLQVHAVAFESFYRVMEKEKGVIVLLPFWCWCDGGRFEEARHRQHRHMIAVAPKGHFFKTLFNEVTITPQDKPFKHYKCFRSLPIQSALHLINTIGYVSQRVSKCQVSSTVKTDLNHFCINITFPKKFKWVLACVWDKGWQQFLSQRYRYMDPNHLLCFAQRVQDVWKIQTKHLPGLSKNVVLPVSKQFFPTTEPTPYFLHLGIHRKLYFEKKEQELGAMEWGQNQAYLGNCFFQAIENGWMTLSNEQNQYLDIVQPFQNRIEQLEMENCYLKMELSEQVVNTYSMKQKTSSQKASSRWDSCVDVLLSCV